MKDRYIDYDPSYGLRDEFPSEAKFKQENNINTGLPALIEKDDIREFIQLLKADNKMNLQTKRAIYLQILCVNRPGDTAEAKWADIDLEKGEWVIQKIVKMHRKHKVSLSI